MSDVIPLGLVCWAATTLIVESEFFSWLRAFFNDRRLKPVPDVKRLSLEEFDNLSMQERHWARMGVKRVWWAERGAYLTSCHWCTGTWIAFVLVAFFGSPWGEWYGFIAGALLVKAIGHLVLELRPQAWWKR